MWKKNGAFEYNWKIGLAGVECLDCTFPHSSYIINHIINAF